MSSDSDSRVSDHGAQIVESTRPTKHVEIHNARVSMDKPLGTTSKGSTKKRGEMVKLEPDSDGSVSDESNTDDSGLDSDSSKDTAEIIADREGGVDLSTGQLPPSYQKSARVDSDDNIDETDGPDSTESEADNETPQEEISETKKSESRKRKTPTAGPAFQGMDRPADSQPTKRAKKTLNRAYLDLLNQDIQHAATQYVASVGAKLDERTSLPSSQIGLTIWTALEKETFFEALGRLGRDNTAAIAQRVHTKGEMEVRQYLKLLHDALIHRRQQNELEPLCLEDFPAAMEISQECCQALEEVADDIARRQERHETVAKETEQGPDWLLCQENRKDLDDKSKDDISRATGLFKTKEWLSLSENFFMNAPSSEGNWQSVDGDRPSMWLEALDDFHSIALTLTRRLVAASNYMAATRTRAELGYKPRLRGFVKEKDVRAAITSLGIPAQKPPLTGCVRRLGLSVYNDPPKPDEDSTREPIFVTDVEDVLDIDGHKHAIHLRHQMGRITLSSDESSISPDSPAESGMESESANGSSDSADDSDKDEEEEEIEAEADEAIFYSAVDPPQTKRDWQGLHRRIKAEREQERYADAVDLQASYQEELLLWSVLGQEPPKSLIEPGPPPTGRRSKLSVDARYTVGKDWRVKTEVVSGWETEYLRKN